MRSVAPDRPGRAASQNSWSVEYVNPIDGSLATTTDQTIHTANESSSEGMEIIRLRRAMARPLVRQNSASSGRQSRSTAPDIAPMVAGSLTAGLCSSGLWISSISGNSGSRSGAATAARSMWRMATCIHTSAVTEIANSSMKQLCHTPVRSLARPNRIGSTNPPSPPIRPTMPPTEPTCLE